MTTTEKHINLPDLVRELEKQGYKLTHLDDNSLTADHDRVHPPVEVDEKSGYGSGKGAKGKKSKNQVRRERRVDLTEEQLDAAVEKLVRQWPQAEKRWIDPPIPNQQYCSISFLPTRGAKPDEKGLYGYVKVRGTWSNENDMDANAENIIKTADSYHAINNGYVGHPLPLVADNDDQFCAEVSHVGMKEKLKTDMTEDMKERRDKEKKDVEEARERAKQAQEKVEEEIKSGKVDDGERYKTLRVKRANHIFSIYQMFTQLQTYKADLLETIRLIEEADRNTPELRAPFMAQYEQAAAAVGIPKDRNHILRYLDGPIPFSLDLIPDQIEVTEAGEPVPPPPVVLLPEDPDLVDFHKVAENMHKAATNEVNGGDEVKYEECHPIQ